LHHGIFKHGKASQKLLTLLDTRRPQRVPAGRHAAPTLQRIETGEVRTALLSRARNLIRKIPRRDTRRPKIFWNQLAAAPILMQGSRAAVRGSSWARGTRPQGSRARLGVCRNV